MVGVRSPKTPRPPPPHPIVPRGVVHVRSAVVFFASVLVYYWFARRLSLFTMVMTLVFLWLSGAFDFLKQLLQLLVITADEANYNDMLRRADIMHQPNVKKMSERGENARLSFGSSCMQGWRRTMEDEHVTVLTDDGGFFGVFDGHSGSNVAKFCGGNMFNFISKTDAYQVKDFTKALYDGFISIDKHIHAKYTDEKSGCTAVVLLVKGDELYCGNAGDSRSVLCRDAGAVPLSNDHKPFLPHEQARIERAGGYVWNRRVNGALALSRAIGDFSFKSNAQLSWDQQAVTCAPEISCSRLDPTHDEFVVLACDGIWDVLSNEQVVEYVRLRIERQMPLDMIAEDLLERCLSPQPFGIGCDNMSVVIVKFKPFPAATSSETTAVASHDMRSSVLSLAGGRNGSPNRNDMDVRTPLESETE
ncbi:putative Protein phosphatase 2C [Trypanosoma vivax]|uniref:protein-serine/threonine phosphatase n=1 Tax=Trypanosoma vivax (strain Y486) TaxID=1055687 RepID=G0U902_TRYVY|nr:putative protein phosphatase 2C [Trypanosoma vivax]KAH8603448.1 putative Protein phosphatase 2C [Trypanosoma vivax]CCC54084.1 putative protein phosphatase 2C [Trypanosoma vivax Y486]